MAKKLHIRPREGFEIRDPKTGELLPAEGRRVPASSDYYQRLLKAGMVIDLDVEAAELAAAEKAEAEKAAAAEAIAKERAERSKAAKKAAAEAAKKAAAEAAKKKDPPDGGGKG